MAKEKESFIFHKSYWHILSGLSGDDVKKFIKSLSEYTFDGINPEWDNNIESALWESFKQNLDREACKYKETCEKRKQAIQKRWEKREVSENTKDTNEYISIQKYTNGYKAIQSDTKYTDTDTDTDTDSLYTERSNIKKLDISRKLDISHKEIFPEIEKSEQSPKKPKEKTIVTKGREIFEDERKTLYPDEPYYWQAKDAKSMKTLLDKIKFSRKEKELPIDDESLLDALRGYFNAVIKLDDDFYNDFDVCKLSSQYNTIVTKIKTNNNGIRKQKSRAFVAEPGTKEQFLAQKNRIQK